MAKYYREDLMLWQPDGMARWYVIEREAAVKEGVRKAIFRADNPWAVAEFTSREEAEEELLRWPSRAEEEAAAGDDTADDAVGAGTQSEAETSTGAQAAEST